MPSSAYALANEPRSTDFFPAAPTKRMQHNGLVDNANFDLIKARRGNDSDARRYWIMFPNNLNTRAHYGASWSRTGRATPIASRSTGPVRTAGGRRWMPRSTPTAMAHGDAGGREVRDQLRGSL